MKKCPKCGETDDIATGLGSHNDNVRHTCTICNLEYYSDGEFWVDALNGNIVKYSEGTCLKLHSLHTNEEIAELNREEVRKLIQDLYIVYELMGE